MKRCGRCKAEKLLDDFGVDRSRHDGKNPKCKACVAEVTAAYLKNHPERRKAVTAKYRAGNAEKCAEAVKAWYWRDNQRARKVRRDYANQNIEATRAKKAKWRTENQDKTRATRADRRSAPGSFGAQDVRALMASQGGCCVYCRTDLSHGYHIDHVMPLALEGSNEPTNIQLLCPPCNLSKGAKHPAVFAQERALLKT